MLKAIDLCCGAGGWACAARGLPIEFRAVVDVDPRHLDTWRLNHEDANAGCLRILADLSTPTAIGVVTAASPQVDLILGGIPCREVSQAAGARSAALTDPLRLEKWHRLIDGVLAIVRALKPRWWAIEDVVPLIRHLPTLLESGFEVPWRIFQAADFGPQWRRRVFLGRFPEPVPVPGPRTLGECLLPGPHLGLTGALMRKLNCRVGRDGVRVLDPGRPCPTIIGGAFRGCRQRRSFAVKTEGRLRQLSLAERALVQGFPPDFLFAETLGAASDQIGQAIPIQLGRAILTAICRQAGLVSPGGVF